MAHCKPEEIEDLKSIIEEILKWDKVQEKGFGKLYLQSNGFLHFHSKNGKRWADIKVEGKWEEFPIPFSPQAKQKKELLNAVKVAYSKNFRVR